MANKIGIGVEIECLTNTNYFTGRIGDYHNGILVEDMPGWRAESDGSLRLPEDEEYQDWAAVEFVSRRCKGFIGLKRALENFKGYYQSEQIAQQIPPNELFQCLEFNDSCGAHIHISMSDATFWKHGLWPAFQNLRNEFFDRMNSSNIQSKHRILNQYNRRYAERVNKPMRYRNAKYLEFNITSEIEGRGLEWRSPNMLGIQTWSEFDEYWDIVILCLKNFCKNVLNCTEVDAEIMDYPDQLVNGAMAPHEIKFRGSNLEDFFSQVYLAKIPQTAKTNSRFVLGMSWHNSDERISLQPEIVEPEIIELVDARTEKEVHRYVQLEHRD